MRVLQPGYTRDSGLWEHLIVDCQLDRLYSLVEPGLGALWRLPIRIVEIPQDQREYQRCFGLFLCGPCQ